MKMKSLVCSCALLVGLAGVAQAHEDVDNDGKFTLLFGGGKYFSDSSRDIGDGNVGEIGLGYIIDKHWAVEAIYTDISSVTSSVTGADVDADMFRLDGLYHFNQNGHWTPYLAAGIGQLSFDTSGGSDDDETAVNFGGGVKYALSKELTARADIRAVYGSDDSDVDTLATIGFNYIFGASSAAAPLDSDGDGVLDADDRCPGTPAGVAVNAKGCALDSDLDGVPNYLDKCHSTKRNVRVDRDGCPMLGSDAVSIELEVLFDTNKADIKPEFMAEIQSVAEFMDQYKGAYAVIEGHTDSMGDAGYNKSLSQRRADAVLAVLVKKMGVNSQRVTAEGFGEERPRAANDTRDGRQLNRRVVAVLKAEVKKVLTK
ncbi:MAG: OmpA family protein [Pseudomonadales bacterium]